MLKPRTAFRGVCFQGLSSRCRPSGRRSLLTLAIESSCDDTSVAIVEKHGTSSPSGKSASLHFLENITADSRQYQGIHPIVALDSHRENMAKLIDKAIRHLPQAENTADNAGRIVALASSARDKTIDLQRKPDFVSVTRGPGMRSNLSTGLDTAKGLSVAWQVPLVGVHHMQAHLLTPRLVSALQAQTDTRPDFPFLSVLVSGGHTLLVLSKSVTDHEIMASTSDIAIGDAIDKIARAVLPGTLLKQSKSTMYGKLLEQFAFPNGNSDYAFYKPPATRGEEIPRRGSDKWGWSFAMPFAETKALEFSFAGLASRAQRVTSDRKLKYAEGGREDKDFLPDEERVDFARILMQVCFEHLASRTVIALEELRRQRKKTSGLSEINTLVISGGVAANQFLRHLLRSFLDIRGFSNVEIVAPPLYLCTDNAAMIGWAGIEMFENGWRSDLRCRALRKWSLDATAEDGGVLGPDDWVKRS